MMADDVPDEKVERLVKMVTAELERREDVQAYDIQEATAKRIEVQVEKDVDGHAEKGLYQVTREPGMEGEEQTLRWEFLGSVLNNDG